MANKIKKSQRFIPLDKGVLGIVSENILFFDSSVSFDDICRAATARFQAAFNLLDCIDRLQKQHFPVDISAEAFLAARILLSDANGLLRSYSKKKWP